MNHGAYARMCVGREQKIIPRPSAFICVTTGSYRMIRDRIVYYYISLYRIVTSLRSKLKLITAYPWFLFFPPHLQPFGPSLSLSFRSASVYDIIRSCVPTMQRLLNINGNDNDFRKSKR